MFVHKFFAKKTENKISHAANSKLFINIFSHVLWNIWRLINTIASIFHKNMLAYLSLGIICSSKLTVFLELHSQKTVQILEQIIPRDKYLCIFLCQIEAIVYLFWENCIPSKSWDAQLKQCLVDHHFNLIHADCLFHFCLLLWRRNIQNVSNSNCLYQITNLYININHSVTFAHWQSTNVP